jgi:peptide/nickel transport system substrate-binding protein
MEGSMSDTSQNPSAQARIGALLEGLGAGRIGRREFLAGAAALGLSTGAATSLMTRTARAATPKRGGHLRVGTDGGATIDTFDPMQTIGTDHITNSVLSCYDSLTEIDGTGTPVPSLAESWDTSKDGKTWTFKLRKGTEFHNGKSLTADDVIWSLNLHLSESNKFAEGKQIVSSLEELKADGKDTVVMVQKEVNYDLPAHLSSIGMFIGPEGTTNWDAGIGTGPYALERFEPGVSFVGKRYPNFYRDDQGFFDSVELLNIADVTNRSNALRTGAVDVIGQPDTKTAKRLDKLDGFSLVEARGAQHFTTAMRTDTDPFTDNNIRLAVKYGIKREEILNKVFGGFGYIGNDHPIGQNVQFYNDALPQREYDPDKSKFHLKKAGLSEITLDLTTSDGAFAGAVDMAVLMQESMNGGGINVNVNRVPGDGYWSDVWLKHPWCAVYWNGRPTVDWMLTVGYISSSSWNDTYFKNERFDSILAAARGESDQAKRKEMYFELQEILHNEGGTTIPVFASYLHGASDKLGHGAVGGYRRMDDNRLARRWWFA